MEKYVIQKTQKITSALYLITDLIKDSDAIKWEIREEGISLVSHSLMLNTTFPVEKEHALNLFISTSEKILSFLKISQTSSLISSMNASIVIHEIESLVNFIQKEEKEIHQHGYILSDTFFETDSLQKDNKRQENIVKQNDNLLSNNIDNKPVKRGFDRKDHILELLKKDSNLTIKDFSKVIKGCSEKTIQRELISLVKKGLVKREGERRWSTYSLA